jgi:hypothetical protein
MKMAALQRLKIAVHSLEAYQSRAAEKHPKAA